MATNILALPLAHVEIETGNNEDWIDVVKYIMPDETPVDLRGIRFEMELRRMPAAHEVILRATSEDRRISIGAFPNVGNLIIAIPEQVMRGYFAGTFVGDIRAYDDRFKRRVITIDLTIVEGITKTYQSWLSEIA